MHSCRLSSADLASQVQLSSLVCRSRLACAARVHRSSLMHSCRLSCAALTPSWGVVLRIISDCGIALPQTHTRPPPRGLLSSSHLAVLAPLRSPQSTHCQHRRQAVDMQRQNRCESPSRFMLFSVCLSVGLLFVVFLEFLDFSPQDPRRAGRARSEKGSR
jgi:hypothetical protein